MMQTLKNNADLTRRELCLLNLQAQFTKSI